VAVTVEMADIGRSTPCPEPAMPKKLSMSAADWLLLIVLSVL
jgi:hypothetical protein